LSPTARTTVRRKRDRASYDFEAVWAILDEALMCHVGFVVDGGPRVIPTIHARLGDVLYLHGAPANFMLGTLQAGAEACVSVTLVDGLVLARSQFHHSVNYRSVCLFGPATVVIDRDEKLAALTALVEHVVPGRSRDARPPRDSELRATLVLRVPLDEASAKIRTGPPLDDAEDLGLDVWAGVVPLRTVADVAVPAPELPEGVATPAYAEIFGRPAARRTGQ
jgi:nitroimidazol reductase NimA-like FMN-containing flavoprotein (pyridoxamine 5'-phosphate oxidase superfamily)